jgi:hypothetical protein
MKIHNNSLSTWCMQEKKKGKVKRISRDEGMPNQKLEKLWTKGYVKDVLHFKEQGIIV